jgi:hypothetical protein
LVRTGLMSNRRLAHFNRHRYCFFLIAHTYIIPYLLSMSSPKSKVIRFLLLRLSV